MSDAVETKDVIAAASERLEASGLPSEWLTVPVHWGVKAKEQADPDKGGLRFSLLNVDVYGEVPERWDNNTEIPRGAIPDTRTEQMGYSIFDKSEVWSDLCADLYEDAIQERWNSSTEIPWGRAQAAQRRHRARDLPDRHAALRVRLGQSPDHRALAAGNLLRLH